ncbi:DNA translocase FtsK [Burkholderia pseudomallei]|uniref:Cell division protein n=27 Tax=Pseudomonadota TaxID=1224 RepID=Q63RR7_BURPS|nr:cell division protein FtsK [Burkholderia mallei ATCC 23344]ABM52673.1 cell division protein FtsK [Burkholderia mallei SAVP1]AUG20235.1 DNA translocase FtsK [Burkholderia pseudomallei]EDS85539.1 DNA translocase FtsK [Burkholderia pseudomallei S13]EEP88858.1 DNA translocase FtsK [Burkholderia mallei GB8 horse 4]EES47577.1 cell division protein FtsK [Burkholderia mallei PRL-20]PNW94071.1 DNA translocase FtsK [Burkholderia sp. 136(2017)]PNX10858.1 DNA translocase FtsK [Burkholderia sp. 129]P
MAARAHFGPSRPGVTVIYTWRGGAAFTIDRIERSAGCRRFLAARGRLIAPFDGFMAKAPYTAQAQALPHRMSRLLTEIRWILQVALLAFLLMALLSYSRRDPSWTHAAQVDHIANWAGRVGAWTADIMLLLFGLSAYWLIVLLGRRVAANYRRITRHDALPGEPEKPAGWLAEGFAFVLVLLASDGIEALRMWSLKVQLPRAPGGVVGETVARGVAHALGFTGGTLALLIALAIGLSLYFRFSWLSVAERVGDAIINAFTLAKLRREAERDRKLGEAAAVKREGKVEEERVRIEEHEPVTIVPPVVTPAKSERAEKERQQPLFTDLPGDSTLPAIALLDPAPTSQETISADTLEFTSRLIEKKLKDFGVEVSVVAAYPGPVVTRYEIEPATGVKGSQIVNLSKDLARSLSLVSIRVVETIPGKNFMALELPNQRRQTVRLSEILGSEVYADAPSMLTLGLGKDIGGKPVCADLAKMPHLLVAGTTGSGKSVGINAMILSLLYKASAEQVRLILIDPKMLEMSVYEGIPHLLCPVVTDMRQAGHALNWTVAEMERRYKLMSKLGVRNLAGYNNKIEDAKKREEKIPNPFSLTPDDPEPLGRLPNIVVVIDELADLMMVVGKKVEELIARIAQKARAAGIHLILATQRPSVDVITGLIKANVPTRIAFQVSSKIDSRTILDQMGAESLLGQGDMLYLPPGSGLPVRVHGAFVSDDEVHRVVEKLKEHGEPNYIEGLLEGGTIDGDEGSAAGTGEANGESDPLYDQAVEIVIKNRRASISLVQRHLRIGYNRAARLLEQMEQSGLVSAMSSSGNREILTPARDAE